MNSDMMSREEMVRIIESGGSVKINGKNIDKIEDLDAARQAASKRQPAARVNVNPASDAKLVAELRRVEAERDAAVKEAAELRAEMDRLTAPSDDNADGAGDDASGGADGSNEDPGALSAEQVIAMVDAIDDPDQLAKIRDEEQAGKNRVSVLKAIDAKLA